MASLKDYLDALRRRKFRNIDPNDVNALRASWQGMYNQSPDHSTSSIDIRNDPNDMPNMWTLKPASIAIGSLEDHVESQSRKVFKRQPSIKTEESESYNHFIK